MSIITAAYAPSSEYLAETISGVEQQTLPEGWQLEWIVQEDGEAPCLAEHFKGISYAHYEANDAQLGAASTRNRALTRATGELVQVLDSDDILLPNALASLIPKFEDSTIHWAVGQADDLMPDGSRVPWPSALPYGRIAAGMVNEWAEEHGANWPIHCAGLMLRVTPLRALGGWIDLPFDEDIAMFAALSEMCDGYNFDGVTWLYRQHSGQTTRNKGMHHLGAASRRFALQRAKAVRNIGLKFGEHRDVLDAGHDVEVGPAAKKTDLTE
ncbi:glycosyltransferase family 2 protein [Spirillospora sp. CA-128828]|uniref:glycosyltransferase family 2 protein n=1 Tax=Spirillospora sp. CA-128828 TaxID=3240033 RepID=UPI003D8F89A6